MTKLAERNLGCSEEDTFKLKRASESHPAAFGEEVQSQSGDSEDENQEGKRHESQRKKLKQNEEVKSAQANSKDH
jgi:hypothetical protein